jgi:hypothetical protein
MCASQSVDQSVVLEKYFYRDLFGIVSRQDISLNHIHLTLKKYSKFMLTEVQKVL